MLATVAARESAGAAVAGSPVTGSLHRAGRWLVDDQGRVVVAHGFNVVKKVAPFVRSEFGEQDARLLADEGFTLARIGFIWEAVEPRPGVYDDAYIQKVANLDDLLAQYGIRTLVDFHQDAWSRGTGGDGAPAWATLGSSADQSFAAFWRNDKAPDGVGLQVHFANAWRHVAQLLAGHRNILGLDPFNEPYPGSDYPPPCSDFSPCASFESGALAAFYGRVIPAIRAGGAQQVIYPEGIADSGVQPPALPGFEDPQTAFTFHFYCNITQFDPREADVGQATPESTACAPIEQRDIGNFLDYAQGKNVPTLLGEFSCSDVNPDNAQIVDQVGSTFTSWSIWAYYTAADDPADCPAQGMLVDDKKAGSQANAKQPKLDALAIPYAQAIAGTPQATQFDRSARVLTLSYDTAPVPGETLGAGALTQVFVPERQYPKGYDTQVTGASVVSAPGAPWLLLQTQPGANAVTLKLTPRADSSTERPLQTGVLPLSPSPKPAPGTGRTACTSRRTVAFHLPRGTRLISVTVSGRHLRARPGPRTVAVSLRGRGGGSVRVRIVWRTRRGRRGGRTSVLHPCAK
jgi:endoglycosylceramidase